MPSWKKVVTSGSNAILQSITSSGAIKAEGSITASAISASGQVYVDYLRVQTPSATSNEVLQEWYVGTTQKAKLDEDYDRMVRGRKPDHSALDRALEDTFKAWMDQGLRAEPARKMLQVHIDKVMKEMVRVATPELSVTPTPRGMHTSSRDL